MALKPGERVTLIKSIGAALSDDERSDIDLTLDEFGVPDLDDREGWTTIYDYITRRTRYAGDAEVIALHAHLYPGAPAPEQLIGRGTGANGPWRPGYFRLFISHTSAHKQLTGDLREALTVYGVDAFVAHTMIEPTKEWADEIETALNTCEALAALLTEDFVSSKWCDQEIGFAVGRGLLVVPIRQGADPHGFIGKYQAVPGDISEFAAERIAKRIYEILVEHQMSAAAMARATVERYVTSGSFDDARTNMQRVEKIAAEHWTDEMVAVVVDAGERNDNLDRGDWYRTRIPDHVRQHLTQILGRPVPDPTPIGLADDDIPF